MGTVLDHTCSVGSSPGSLPGVVVGMLGQPSPFEFTGEKRSWMGESGRAGVGDLLRQHHPQGSRPDPWGPAGLVGPCPGLPACQ